MPGNETDRHRTIHNPHFNPRHDRTHAWTQHQIELYHEVDSAVTSLEHAHAAYKALASRDVTNHASNRASREFAALQAACQHNFVHITTPDPVTGKLLVPRNHPLYIRCFKYENLVSQVYEGLSRY